LPSRVVGTERQRARDGDESSKAYDTGFDAHAAHERRDVTPPDSEAATTQHVAKHSRPSKRILQMQFVDGRLSCKRQLVRSIDHRFALEPLLY